MPEAMPQNPPITSLETVQEPTSLWTRTFFTILFVNFCVFLGFNMLLPTLSLFLHEEKLTEREIGLVFGSFTISAITFRLLASKLAQRFGTLTVVRLGFFTCGLGAICYVLVHHMGFYFLARLMQGAGFAVSSTLLVSVASNIIPPRRLGEGIGYVGLGATLSLAMGPVLGLYLAHSYGFSLMFAVSALTCIAAMLISFMLPKVSAYGEGKKATETRSWLEKTALPATLLTFIYAAGVSAVTVYLAIYCELNGLPPAANFFMVSTIGTIIARLTAGRIYDRKGHLFVVPPSAIMLIVSVIYIIMVPSKPVLYLMAVVYGLGAGGIFPSLQTMTLASVPATRRTIASAYFFVAFDLGIGLGTIFLGFVAGHFHNYTSVFVGSICFFASLLILYFFLFWKSFSND
ncbi:MAG: MFS transporter [Deltaproteobacteria bacterium]|jgi:MFS family permease|nr:MFS transporter [Deltaproteobacteria bacterium]